MLLIPIRTSCSEYNGICGKHFWLAVYPARVRILLLTVGEHAFVLCYCHCPWYFAADTSHVYLFVKHPVHVSLPTLCPHSRTVHSTSICVPNCVNPTRVGRPVTEEGPTGIDLGAMRSATTKVGWHRDGSHVSDVQLEQWFCARWVLMLLSKMRVWVRY